LADPGRAAGAKKIVERLLDCGMDHLLMLDRSASLEISASRRAIA
jgi:hypothetical protein